MLHYQPASIDCAQEFQKRKLSDKISKKSEIFKNPVRSPLERLNGAPATGLYSMHYAVLNMLLTIVHALKMKFCAPSLPRDLKNQSTKNQ